MRSSGSQLLRVVLAGAFCEACWLARGCAQAVLCCGVSHLLPMLLLPLCLAGNKLYQQGSRSVTGLEAALSCGGLQHKAGTWLLCSATVVCMALMAAVHEPDAAGCHLCTPRIPTPNAQCAPCRGHSCPPRQT